MHHFHREFSKGCIYEVESDRVNMKEKGWGGITCRRFKQRGCASGHTYIFQSFGRTYLINTIEIWKKLLFSQ